MTGLVENTAQGRALMGEHGLAFHIRAGAESMLFDTGQSGLIARNAQRLGVGLGRVGAVALSHGHYDHTGGLPTILAAARKPRLFLHPAARERKFRRRKDGVTEEIGFSAAAHDALQGGVGALVATDLPTEVVPGIFVTGQVPRRTTFEDNGGVFFLDPAGTRPDPLLDDQALFFDTPEGVVVLCGCAHSGVGNIVETVGTLAKGRPIRTIIGGLHLHSASDARIEATIALLGRIDGLSVHAGHCTGPKPTAALWNAFPGRCGECSVGTRFEFEARS